MARRLSRFGLACLAATTMPGAVSAQDVAGTGGEPIVVEGRKSVDGHDAATSLPRVLSVSGNGQIPRWNGSICVEMIGLAPAQSRFFLERLGAVAGIARLDVRAGRRCENRVMVVFTGDWISLSERLYARRSPLAALIVPPSDETPVRWASDAEMRGADGERPVDFVFPANQPDVGPMRTVKGFNAHAPTRLARATRMDLQGMTLVVDASHLRSVSNGALASYLAMVIVGNVRPDHGELVSPSILNLFAQPNRAPADGELSDWDRRYLAALYAGIGNLGADRKTAEMIAVMMQ